MIRLANWEYIRTVPLTDETAEDISALLDANGRGKTAEHCRAVADVSTELAVKFGADTAKARKAALLHDISAVIKPEDMLLYARKNNWELDEAELRYPFLLHQRLSAEIARDAFGVTDEEILTAIDCHTTLKSAPGKYDMILFLADKLSWDQYGVPPFSAEVAEAMRDCGAKGLYRGALAYIDYVMDHRMVLLAHKRLLSAREWLRAHVLEQE